MSSNFAPLLAVAADETKLVFPGIASPKLDGIRGLVQGTELLSRKLLQIPNRYWQSIIADSVSGCFLDGMDGELICGSPTAKNCYNVSVSAVMTENPPTEISADVKLYVFDLHNIPMMRYQIRLNELENRVKWINQNYPDIPVVLHESRYIYDYEQLLAYEADCLGRGYEGLIYRSLDGLYKYGRSTVRQGIMLKIKRFADDEAKIIGFDELRHNNNIATIDELGHTKRSSHQDNKVGGDTLGALIVRDVKTGVAFNIGTGMDAAFRQRIWNDREKYMGALVKYKHFPIGQKDAPRHPVFIGFRDPIDC